MDHEDLPVAQRRWRDAAMAAAVCSLVCLGSLTAGAQPAATPDELIANAIAAAREGSLDRFLECLEPGSRRGLLAAIEEGRALDQGMAAFEAALDRRFDGGGPLLEMSREEPVAALRRLAETEILETRTTPTGVEIRVRIAAAGEDGTAQREETLVAVRGERGWGLVLGFSPLVGRDDRHRALAQVTEGVAAGAFASRLDAMIAADKAVRGERP